MKKQLYFLLLLLTGFALKAHSQVNESPQHQAYEYLYRMAQKGIVAIDDYVLPLDRATLYALLDSVKSKSHLLTHTEQEELAFYTADFLIDNTPGPDQLKILDRHYQQRPRMFYATGKGNALMIDPVFGVSSGKYQDKSSTTYFGGLRMYGKLGRHIGFNFFFRDVTERGDTTDLGKGFNNYKGRAGGTLSNNKLNYGEVNFNIGYTWKDGALTIGKDNMVWGYGQAGNMVLSAKAPSYPYIRLDYYPFTWLHFNYMHGWLMSNQVDSNATYGTGSGVSGSERISYIPKFIAHHSITVQPVKGLKIAIGESIVYSDKMDVGYLIPINFFKAYDHYASSTDIRSGGNGQFFGQVSSRNHIKNTHLYAGFFVDEIRLTKIFSTGKRNQLGYTVGGSITDVGISYLTLAAEYAHINPFVYSNLIPAQLYTTHDYSLGDWMSNNADRLYLAAKYTPVAKLKAKAWFQYIRKGSAGTLVQQYDEQNPQPPFLFGRLFNQTEAGGSLQYEWIQGLKLHAMLAHTTTDYTTGNTTKGLSFVAGFSYGL